MGLASTRGTGEGALVVAAQRVAVAVAPGLLLAPAGKVGVGRSAMGLVDVGAKAVRPGDALGAAVRADTLIPAQEAAAG